MRNTILRYAIGLGIGVSALVTPASAYEDWTNHLAIYGLELEGSDMSTWTSVRSSTALSGVATTTSQEFDRHTQTWSPDTGGFYRDTVNHQWIAWGTEEAYTISGTGNSLYSLVDGTARMTTVTDVSGQTLEVIPYYGVDVTFSAGAELYELEFQEAEYWELNWIATDFSDGSQFTTLEALVNSGLYFFGNSTDDVWAGFPADANWTQGYGNIVDSTMDANVVGTWALVDNIAGEAMSAIEFTLDPEFTNADIEFATVHEGVVHMGEYVSAKSVFEPVTDEVFGNEIAYNDMAAAIAAHDFSKLVYGDVAGKLLSMMDSTTGNIYDSLLFSNMTFVTAVNGAPMYEGTWSVENGVFTRDVTFSPSSKGVFTTEIDTILWEYTDTLTGNGTFTESTGMYQIFPISYSGLSDVTVPYPVSVDDIKGKKLVDGSDVSYFFNNMTYYSTGPTGDDMGTWKVENGVLVVDSTWTATGGVEMATMAVVFNSDPLIDMNATVYEAYLPPETFTTGTLESITGSESTSIFDNTPVPYQTSISEIAGKKVVIEYLSGPDLVQDTIYFHENMTFEHVLSTSETITGAWSVEGGVIIADVVYADADAEQHVIIFDAAPAVDVTYTNYGTMASDPVKGTGKIISVSDIAGASGASPAVIMYLLN